MSAEPTPGLSAVGDGQFTSDKLAEALADVCAVAGLDPPVPSCCG